MPQSRSSPAEDPHADRSAPDRSADRPAAVAQAILAGFDRHFGLTRYIAQQAKSRYERGDRHGIRRLGRDRIAVYDQRVHEAGERLESEFALGQRGQRMADDWLWPRVKRNYVALLADHRQPELAETFFNSVCCNILHRSY